MRKKTAVLVGFGILGGVLATFILNTKYRIKVKITKKNLIETIKPLPGQDCTRIDIDRKIH